MPINITFRTQLLGGVSEFSQNINIPVFMQTLNLVELIVLLARYQEEGKKLAPKVYVTNDISALCSMLPDSEIIRIGSCAIEPAGIKQSLKKCAPLATGGWMVYLHDNNGKDINFGLFKGSSNPISVLVDNVALTKNDDLIVVKVFKIADDCIEIKSNKGGQHYIFLDHRKEESPPPLQYLDSLVSNIVTKVKQQYYETTKTLLSRLLFDSLRESHGCIVAVINKNQVPKFLSEDGIILENPIDFGRLVESLMMKEIDQSQIDSKGFLLKGMLNSDGILIFDNRGRLLGYNCFIKTDKKSEVIGGARKRAFFCLKNKLGKGLCGVFMQSQDGWSDFEGVE